MLDLEYDSFEKGLGVSDYKKIETAGGEYFINKNVDPTSIFFIYKFIDPPKLFYYYCREIDLLDWHNLLEVNIDLGHLLRVPNLKVLISIPTTHVQSECTVEP